MRSCLSASAKGSQRLVLMAATNADVPTAMRKADEVDRGAADGGPQDVGGRACYRSVEVVPVSNSEGEKNEACEHERGLGRVGSLKVVTGTQPSDAPDAETPKRKCVIEPVISHQTFFPNS